MADMEYKLFRIICKKGHRSNAMIWKDQSIKEYLGTKKCNSCCSDLELA